MDRTSPEPLKPRSPSPAKRSRSADEESLASTRIVESLQTPSDPGIGAHIPTEGDQETPAPTPRTKSARPAPKSLGGYQLTRKLGEGAMGAVYLARHEGEERDVALKVLFPHIADNPKLVERLYREGRVMGALDHPNLIQAYAIGEDQGWHYVAMECVDGESLQRHIDRLAKLSVADAIHVTLACLHALEYAHKAGIVHRDIKPDNVLVERKTGAVKVADLGMMKAEDEEMALTQTGHAVGTPWYMPLEQARNAKDVDGRSDIYAVGCMLYCMLVGHPPFRGRTIVEVIQAKEAGTFPPARKFNAEVPEKLDLVILKMTSKLVKHRYQTCAEAIADLEELGLAGATLGFLKKTVKLARAEGDTTVRVGGVGGDTAVAEPTETDVWFLRVMSEGTEKPRKLNTSQIQKMLNEGTIGPNARVSKRATDGYRAIATFKEFADAAMRRKSQRGAAVTQDKYKDLYKQIEDKETKREKDDDRERDSLARNYWFSIAWKVGAGFAALGALVFFLKWIARGLAG